ncbi:hypothetical protein F25303_11726 [Fusarium sp. NRRL 25303]|nr:hypothetical protein F25303_11726 [Fusarium sp. NRRL 25303]
MLPAEVHLLIGGFLKPSEMEGLIVSPGIIRKRYSKSYFHDVAFRGTKADLMEELTAFLNANNTQATTRDVVVPAIDYITIEIEPEVPSPGPDMALVLPRLIASSLGVMKNLQRQELLDRCAGLPVWNSLHLINMENELEVYLQQNQPIDAIWPVGMVGSDANPCQTIVTWHDPPGSQGTGVGLPAVKHYVRQWNEQIFAGIPALQQVAFIHGDIVLRAVREADAAIRFSVESDLDRHAFPFGTLY